MPEIGERVVRRVMIVGQPGSGKSTLARMLGQVTGLPVFHMDRIHWMAGWVERPQSEKIAMARAVEAQDLWIFEGGLSVTWPERSARADLVVWLDVPLWRRMWRVARRSVVHHGQVRPDLPEGCPERLGPETLPFWRWIWDTRHSGRRGIERLLAGLPPDKRVVRLTTVAGVQRFLAGLG